MQMSILTKLLNRWNSMGGHAGQHATLGIHPSPRNGLLGILGDSRSQSAGVFVASNTYITNDWLPLANASAGAPFKLSYFGGISGQTTTQILARVGDAIASGISVCAVLGGTNDGWASQSDVDATYTNLVAIYTALKAAGIYVIALSELPNTTKGTSFADFAVYLNKRLKDYWLGRAGGEFVDCYSSMLVPSTGIGDASCFHDGLHPGAQGAYRMKRNVAPVLTRLKGQPYRPLIGSVRDLVTTNALSNNYCANPLMQGTSGTIGSATGQLPTGYTNNSTATCAYSVVARADGVGNDVRVVASATSGQVVDFYQTIVKDPFTYGSQWVIDCEVNVESGTAVNEISTSATCSTFAFRANATVQAVTGIDYSSPETWHIASTEFSIAPGLAAVQTVLVRHTIKFASGSAGAATVRFGRLSVRKLA